MFRFKEFFNLKEMLKFAKGNEGFFEILLAAQIGATLLGLDQSNKARRKKQRADDALKREADIEETTATINERTVANRRSAVSKQGTDRGNSLASFSDSVSALGSTGTLG